MNNSIEYLTAKAVDPFIDEKERKNYINELCDKIVNEYDGPYIAMKFLSYRLLSPDQNEALNTLEVMDICVKKCGSKISNEIGKYKFLNQFIRLLSPKYQGIETSSNVKNKAITLLYTWKQTMKNIQKLQQVYNMLKEQCIIDHDPICDDYIPQVPKSPPRYASFEDEEKSQLLNELLKSKNPQDLQAANRLIKSMVRSDEQKNIKKMEKKQTMDTAKNYAQLLQEMLNKSEYNIFDEYLINENEITIINEMYQWLMNIRSKLFKYASEATENQDENLNEILNLNDIINKALELYQNKVNNSKSSTIDNSLIESTMMNKNDSSNNKDDDLLSILTPIAKRKEYKADIDLNDIFDPKPSTSNITNAIISDLKTFKIDELFSSKKEFKNDDIPSSISELSISSNKTPYVYFNDNLIKGILYPANYSKVKNSNIQYFVNVISSTNPNPITNICFKISCISDKMPIQLLPSPIKSLSAFHPINSSPNVTQILMILPVENDINKIELLYKLTYESPEYHYTEGKIEII